MKECYEVKKGAVNIEYDTLKDFIRNEVIRR